MMRAKSDGAQELYCGGHGGIAADGGGASEGCAESGQHLTGAEGIGGTVLSAGADAVNGNVRQGNRNVVPSAEVSPCNRMLSLGSTGPMFKRSLGSGGRGSVTSGVAVATRFMPTI